MYSNIDVSRYYLSHHGIKGMKWGIRRFQPYPKGYSGGGKEVGDAKKKRWSKKSYDAAASNFRTISNVANEAKGVTRSVGNLTKKKNVDVSSMSDEELKAIVSRLNLEQQYNKLTSNDVRSGAEVVNDILGIIGGVAAIGATAVTLAGTLKGRK